MSDAITEDGARRLAAAIVKRAVLDAEHNSGGQGFAARRWLLFGHFAVYLLDALNLSRARVRQWVLSLDPLPLEDTVFDGEQVDHADQVDREIGREPTSDGVEFDPDPEFIQADSWPFDQVAEYAQVDLERIAEMVNAGQLDMVWYDGQMHVANTPAAWRFFKQRWRVSMGLDDDATG